MAVGKTLNTRCFRVVQPLMPRRRRRNAWLLAALLAACGTSTVAERDAGTPAADGGAPDAGVVADGGTLLDGGTALDGGAAPDGGAIAPDGGFAPDAGAPLRAW